MNSLGLPRCHFLVVAASDASGRTYLWDAATGAPLGASLTGRVGVRHVRHFWQA